MVKKGSGIPALHVNIKWHEFVHLMCLKDKSNTWLNDSLSDNSNNNECVRQELIRSAMLRKHFLKVKWFL